MLDRTFCEANANAFSSDGMRTIPGPFGSPASSSVVGRPGTSKPIADVMTSGRPLPASTVPSILLRALPPVVHIRTESDKATLRWSLDRMREEVREQRPGGVLITQHIAYTMLVQAIRLYLEGGFGGGVGWLFGLADKQLSAAINAMHEDPAHRWTLQTLAGHAGMSRSVFAFKFKETVGSSAMDYLTRWRMLLAGDKLTYSQDSISTIALSLGYESESAFSKAFKRVMGCSPRQYARGCNPASPSHREGKAARANRLELIAG